MRCFAALWIFMVTTQMSITVIASGHTPYNRRPLKHYNPRLPPEQRRTTTTTSDTCASITMDLAQALSETPVYLAIVCCLCGSLQPSSVSDTALGTKIPQIFGNVNFCLCLKGVSSFIKDNIICDLAVAQKGTASVTTAMINIVNNYSGKKSCSYPANALPACIASDACAFTCSDGYTASEGNCMCNGYECNGKCQSSKCANPSHGMSRRKSRTPTCPVGYTMCGVPDVDKGYLQHPASRTGVNHSIKRAYECLETRSNIESCGGCVVPLTINGKTGGEDCTAIPHATAVSCQRGNCIVEQCRTGYTPNTARSACTLA